MGYNKNDSERETPLKSDGSGGVDEGLCLTSDLVFKATFGRDRRECREALMGLLNAILGEEDAVTDLTYINPFNLQDFESAKLSCMDIKLVTKKGERISVEMQMVVEPVFIRRSIYYGAQLVTEELKQGEDYKQINRSIFIGILAHNLFEDDRVHRKYRLKDVESHEELSDLLELHYVEIQKADGEREIHPDGLSEVEKWALYLRYAGDPSKGGLVRQLTAESEVLEMAETIRREVSKDEEMRAREFSRRLFQMDITTRLNESLRSGIELGRKQGYDQGSKQGYDQGTKQGTKQGIEQVAREMLDRGMDLQLISEITKLSIEELEKL